MALAKSRVCTQRLNRDGSNMQTSICERICSMDWVGGMKIMFEGGQKKIFGWVKKLKGKYNHMDIRPEHHNHNGSSMQAAKHLC